MPLCRLPRFQRREATRTPRFATTLLAAALLLPLAAPPAASLITPPALVPASVTLTPIASGLSMPLLVTNADDGSGRVFTVEQRGIVRVVGDATPYLDIRSKIRCCGERGLLGVAFAPDFETTGRLYVSYSRASDGAHILERLTVAQPATGRPPTSGEVLIALADPFSNHNGGHVAFGPDGMLYLAFGDGGSADDPQQNGQNVNVLLGKLLRLDVSGTSGYAIPPDNPFAAGGGRPEIWAYGLRNPWRFSFDEETNDLWIADVGQNVMEEVNKAPSTAAGLDYGWDVWEGLLPHEGVPDPTGVTFPVLTYLHGPHCSVTGGHVMRGPTAGELAGRYVFADFCSGFLWAANEVAGVATSELLAQTGFPISSFGEDEAGNVYVVDYNGRVLRIDG